MARGFSYKESIYQHFAAHIRKHGKSPTYRATSQRVGCSMKAVYTHVHALCAEGRLRYSDRYKQGIRLPEDR